MAADSPGQRPPGSDPASTRRATSPETEVAHLLDRFCSRAQHSRLKPFVTLAATIRKHRDGILAAIRLGINNARHEGLNRRVRLIINRAYGFHTARAALALIMLTVGPITAPTSCPTSEPAFPSRGPHSCREAPKWFGHR